MKCNSRFCILEENVEKIVTISLNLKIIEAPSKYNYWMQKFWSISLKLFWLHLQCCQTLYSSFSTMFYLKQKYI